MVDFLILGLPRSRTAWLANFLTYDGLFCFHEATNGCSSIQEYKEKVAGKGDANTGLGFFDIDKLFPDAKKIIVDSDVSRSIEFSKAAFNLNVVHEMRVLKNNLDKIDGLHIPLDEINDHLQEIWEYITDIPYDKERAD
ncbi:MAG: hypothetical protein R3240_03730, partial [Gammaproteobacteria bacterium]|nr:hypothetical protein [Gammaproteobacteria bacterium]